MLSSEPPLPAHYQAIINRFLAACRADDRIMAAFLVGSHATGTADLHSDLDLYLITTDEAYEAFVAGRVGFVRSLGEPAFMESFGRQDIVFLIFPDGAEVEITMSPEGQIEQVYGGAYRVLVDKKGIFGDGAFPRRDLSRVEQIETLRQQIYWFWHNLSHFVTATARGQLWWAHGQLDALRNHCINLARLRHDMVDTGVGEEGYFKVEEALPVEQLSPLQVTFCPLERNAMLEASRVIVRFYRDLAPELAREHGIVYPASLETVMLRRLEELSE